MILNWETTFAKREELKGNKKIVDFKYVSQAESGGT